MYVQPSATQMMHTMYNVSESRTGKGPHLVPLTAVALLEEHIGR